ncbi:hypothetical protein BJX65DRAFT_297033 [Aspergillus insuetus]
MALLNWFLSLFWRWKSEDTRGNRPSEIELLPPELILCITDHLSTEDIVCLKVCNRTLYKLVRKPCFLADKSTTVSVLTRIATDLPRMFCCGRCGKFHRNENVGHPLDYCHLIVAMKNHYNGHKHGLLPESLAYTEVNERESFPLVTQLISVDSRVCSLGGGPSTLVFQVQNWVLYKYSADMIKAMSLEHDIIVCKHLCLDRSAKDYFAWFDSDSNITDGFKHLACQVCGIEFQLALRDCGTEGKATVVTKWVDLGAGLEWNDPTSRRTEQLFLYSMSLQEKVNFPIEHTTSRNHACLMEKRYRNWMVVRVDDPLYWSTSIPGLHSNVN